MAKLTACDVAHIRERARRGEVQRRLAHEFEVSEQAISQIVRRKRWA